MLNVRLIHGKHVNRVTHVKRTFIDPRFTYVKERALNVRFEKKLF